jgi:hypothetical protein
MSGHRKFSELTKNFTKEDRKVIEAKKAEMRAALRAEGPNKGLAAPAKTQEQNSHTATGR